MRLNQGQIIIGGILVVMMVMVVPSVCLLRNSVTSVGEAAGVSFGVWSCFFVWIMFVLRDKKKECVKL